MYYNYRPSACDLNFKARYVVWVMDYEHPDTDFIEGVRPFLVEAGFAGWALKVCQKGYAFKTYTL